MGLGRHNAIRSGILGENAAASAANGNEWMGVTGRYKDDYKLRSQALAGRLPLM